MPARTDWIVTTLLNDESSTDQELINHFRKEGEMLDYKARAIVDLRQDALRDPWSTDSLKVKVEEILNKHNVFTTHDRKEVERWVEVSHDEWNKYQESDREILKRNDGKGIRFVIREHIYNKGGE